MKTDDKQDRLIPDTPRQTPPVDCPVEDWLSFLGHRWNALLLWHLSTSPKLHSELHTLLLGISSKVLTERLSTLAKRGLITKTPQATYPRTVRYALSEQGCDMINILHQIELWAKKSKKEHKILKLL